MSTALISGVTGQDGSYLAEQLLARGWTVHGMVRRTSTPNDYRIKHLKGLQLHEADVTDLASVMNVMQKTAPTHVYNLAAQSFVGTSWQQPILTANVTGLGAANMLEAFRKVVDPVIGTFFQASSSEMYGTQQNYIDEKTPFHPRSPYGVAKVFAHHMAVNYRESYGLRIYTGIMFNHESPRRGLEFVTRKIARAAARISLGHKERLKLGNMNAKRDWGYAPDFTRAMVLLTQPYGPDPGDYVIATGEARSVYEFTDKAFEYVNLNWADHTDMDASLQRPADIEHLVGDSSKIERCTGWHPTVKFHNLVALMVNAERNAPENKVGL